ncbi:MAG: isoprenyl transferase [Cohaesibacter sp.]|nr:isoprenyl transferase [Cohaesibacter sp.]
MNGQGKIADLPQSVERMAIPRHLAVIMDGNGRWAKARGLSRTQGHRQGVSAVREIVKNAADLGIEYLTLFSFSSENWSRPESEVRDLMGLLKLFIRNDLAKLKKQNVKVVVIGCRKTLTPDIAQLLCEAEEKTIDNNGLKLVIAFNYGARQEITQAVRSLAERVAQGKLSPEAIDEAAIANALYSRTIPDPDLILRTSGEQRLSNFLLWQAAYSEFVFVDCYWPDFGRQDLEEALMEFAGRDRRFGGVVSKTNAVGSAG